MKDIYQYLRLFISRKLLPAKVMNHFVILVFAYTLLSNIWVVGRKVDQSISYLEEIPRLRKELADLKYEKDATRDSLRLFRNETATNFKQVAGNLEQMDNRISHTNHSVKNELKRMNDYFILLSSSNEEIKRMLLIKKENDNLLFEQLFSSMHSTRNKP
jgi:hypothetical protein